MTRGRSPTGSRSATRSCAARPRPAWRGSARWSGSTSPASPTWSKRIVSRSCHGRSAGVTASPARPGPAAGGTTSTTPSSGRCTSRWAAPWSNTATRSTSRSRRRAKDSSDERAAGPLRARAQPVEPARGKDQPGDLRVAGGAGVGAIAGGDRLPPDLVVAQLLDQGDVRDPVAGAAHAVGVGELGDPVVDRLVVDRRRADDEAPQPHPLRPEQHLFEGEQGLLLAAAAALVFQGDVVDAEGEDDARVALRPRQPRPRLGPPAGGDVGRGLAADAEVVGGGRDAVLHRGREDAPGPAETLLVAHPYGVRVA